MTTITVTAQATAASGYLQESCAASPGDSCALLPVTVDIVSAQQVDGQSGADGVTDPACTAVGAYVNGNNSAVCDTRNGPRRAWSASS